MVDMASLEINILNITDPRVAELITAYGRYTLSKMQANCQRHGL